LSAVFGELRLVGEGEGAYDHGSQVVRSVVVWPRASCFEGLFTTFHDLLEIDAFEEFGDGVSSASLVIDEDLDSGNLVIPEGTVVATSSSECERFGKKRGGSLRGCFLFEGYRTAFEPSDIFLGPSNKLIIKFCGPTWSLAVPEDENG
jgi:hypothetical protein